MGFGRVVIIGAGALGLGFLAERMAEDYDLLLADVGAKADVLQRIEREQGYSVNLCGLDGISRRWVHGNIEVAVTDTPEGRQRLDESLVAADLVLTVTGRSILDRLVPEIAPTLASSGKRQWLLFCENGLDIAKTYAPQLGDQTVALDTVMSRMCRFAGPAESAYTPMWPGGQTSLVVEDFEIIPVDSERSAGGPFSPVFSLVSTEEFLCWEDVKLYMHNGMHAFVAYHAYLEGVRYFPDTPARIRAKAQEVMLGEVVPAVAATHPAISREWLERYGRELLQRFFNPYFNDSVERGVRGTAEKLAPNERLHGGCDYIRKAGIEPAGYSSTIKAAEESLLRGSSE